MKDELFFILAIEKIARKTEWGPIDSWTADNYSILNEEIKKATGKRISESTLKRMFRKKKTPADFYNPHNYTKNILAEYLGYENWEEFKKDNRGDRDMYAEEIESGLRTLGRDKRQAWFIVALIFFILLVILLFFHKKIFPGS